MHEEVVEPQVKIGRVRGVELVGERLLMRQQQVARDHPTVVLGEEEAAVAPVEEVALDRLEEAPRLGQENLLAPRLDDEVVERRHVTRGGSTADGDALPLCLTDGSPGCRLKSRLQRLERP